MAERAQEKLRRKGKGKGKGGKEEGGERQTTVPELMHTAVALGVRVSCTIIHHLNVALLILPRITEGLIIISVPELSIYWTQEYVEVCVCVCVWGGGGGGAHQNQEFY